MTGDIIVYDRGYKCRSRDIREVGILVYDWWYECMTGCIDI